MSFSERDFLAALPQVRNSIRKRFKYPEYMIDDIMQEAALHAWRHRDQYDETKGSLAGWLVTIAKNLVFSRGRTGEIFHRGAKVEALDPLDGRNMLLDGVAEARAEHIRFVGEISRMKDGPMLLYAMDTTIYDAADRFGMSKSNVHRRSKILIDKLCC